MRQINPRGVPSIVSDIQLLADRRQRGSLAAEYSDLQRALELERALREIINTLGPTVCECPQHSDCGLRDEATEALQVAKRALFVA